MKETEEVGCDAIVRRELPFARQLVWEAMTVAEHANQWWGPDGFCNENVRMDFRVGGAWTFDMVGPDGTRYPNHSVFRDIVPPKRMVYEHGDGQTVWFVAEITLEETETGTLVTICHRFPTPEDRVRVVTEYGALEGGKQHLRNLETYIKESLLAPRLVS